MARQQHAAAQSHVAASQWTSRRNIGFAAEERRESRIGPWKCQVTGTDARANGGTGSVTGEGNRPLVLVIGFLGSNRRILSKYAEVYDRAGLEVRIDEIPRSIDGLYQFL